MKFCTVATSVFVLGRLSFAMTLLLNGSPDGAVLDPESVPATAVVTNVVRDSKKPVVGDLCGDYGAVGRESQPKRLTLGKGHSDTEVFFHVNVQDGLELVRRYELGPVLALAAIDRCEPLSQAARLSALPTIKAVPEALEKENLCESRHHCPQLD
ncbi:MAG: hypothetical protein P8N76_11310 [Pirellulaceae bacterium]|nr:hypothetical protein [Pirellulaceae bacterium]